MRIAFIVTRADALGGSQMHVLDLASALLSRGHEATVLLGGEGPVIGELERRRIRYYSVRHLRKPLRPVADIRASLEICNILRAIRPQLVAAHTAKAGMVARWAAALVGIPAVFTPHGWAISDRISPRQGKMFKIFEQMAGRVSARIINVCEAERRLAVRHRIAPRSKLVVVHNGICDVPAELRARPAIQPPRLLTVARFEEPKDYRTLLIALSTLKEVPWKFDLAGDGPLLSRMQQLAAELGILDRVRFLGARSDVDSLLAQAQIFVLSTRSEAFPYTVLEAMRAGLPVVSSDAGGICEAVENGQTGVLVPVKNPLALRNGLYRLIVDPELRTRMGDVGRARYLDSFTIDKMVNKTLQIYREVITGNYAADRLASARRNQEFEVAPYGTKSGI